MSQQLDTANCDTAAWITLRWTRGTRYYRVHLEQDLWADWLLTHVNGRIGTPLGRARAPSRGHLGSGVTDFGGGRETPAPTRI
jgi:hypothetical protein